MALLAAIDGLDDHMLPPPQRPLVLKQMVGLHQRLETRGAHDATPRMYVALTQTWRKIFVSQRQKISDRVEHLGGGLQKLAEAEERRNCLGGSPLTLLLGHLATQQY